jgi:transposase
MQPTDMRKGFNSLSSLVQNKFDCELTSGHLFVFTSKCKSRVKILWFDSDGFALLYKRLEVGTFKMPRSITGDIKAVEIDAIDLMALLGGFELVKVKRQLRFNKEEHFSNSTG